MEINQGSVCLHLLKKIYGLLLKDTVKGLVMDPPLNRQLNLQGPLAFVATVSVFFGAKKDCAKNGVSKRGGVRGEGRKLQALYRHRNDPHHRNDLRHRNDPHHHRNDTYSQSK